MLSGGSGGSRGSSDLLDDLLGLLFNRLLLLLGLLLLLLLGVLLAFLIGLFSVLLSLFVGLVGFLLLILSLLLLIFGDLVGFLLLLLLLLLGLLLLLFGDLLHLLLLLFALLLLGGIVSSLFGIIALGSFLLLSGGGQGSSSLGISLLLVSFSLGGLSLLLATLLLGLNLSFGNLLGGSELGIGGSFSGLLGLLVRLVLLLLSRQLGRVLGSLLLGLSLVGLRLGGGGSDLSLVSGRVFGGLGSGFLSGGCVLRGELILLQLGLIGLVRRFLRLVRLLQVLLRLLFNVLELLHIRLLLILQLLHDLLELLLKLAFPLNGGVVSHSDVFLSVSSDSGEHFLELLVLLDALGFRLLSFLLQALVLHLLHQFFLLVSGGLGVVLSHHALAGWRNRLLLNSDLSGHGGHLLARGDSTGLDLSQGLHDQLLVLGGFLLLL